MLVNLLRGQLSVWKLRLSEKKKRFINYKWGLLKVYANICHMCIPIDLELFNNHASGEERVGGLEASLFSG